jgi:1,4-alpha-glucan branching enzyme
MRREHDGWWTVEVPQADPGTDYGYLIDDATSPLPDPRSRWQPNGVHEMSRVYDAHAYKWSDRGWTGRDLPGAVIYEMHVGTFTPAGTFDGAIARLDHLAELGITHVEVMPVNAVNGVWNWGYDGVGWYAVHEPLGGPDGFKRFVDACHQRGLAVILDVVYNHFGASGNYLPEFGPYLKRGENSWGNIVNLDGDGSADVRRFIIENALMWLEDYHLDGLRLDAVHALVDRSKVHLAAEQCRTWDGPRAPPAWHHLQNAPKSPGPLSFSRNSAPAKLGDRARKRGTQPPVHRGEWPNRSRIEKARMPGHHGSIFEPPHWPKRGRICGAHAPLSGPPPRLGSVAQLLSRHPHGPQGHHTRRIDTPCSDFC